ELSEVYFQASSFLVGKPLSSKTLMAEVRMSWSSSSTLTRSSKAINDDSNLSFNAIILSLQSQSQLAVVDCFVPRNDRLKTVTENCDYTSSSLIQSYPFSSNSRANSFPPVFTIFPSIKT